jgi:catechol 2,3-dioxygenase-like lactoylglutathione lyase family enzyme
MKFLKMDHVSVVVNDLAAAKAFFLDFGLELRGEGELEAEWVDKVVGIKGVRSGFAVLGTPGGGTNIELIKYYRPVDENGSQPPNSNTLGISNIAFEVDDIEAVYAGFKAKGMPHLGEIQQFENIYKLCYCRGPEGIIIMLAERLK